MEVRCPRPTGDAETEGTDACMKTDVHNSSDLQKFKYPQQKHYKALKPSNVCKSTELLKLDFIPNIQKSITHQTVPSAI